MPFTLSERLTCSALYLALLALIARGVWLIGGVL